jgi:Rrf2 family cysteine metabolism transcriptional repressor
LAVTSIDSIEKARRRKLLMKLTTKSEYSILAPVYMARNEKNGFMKIEEICSKCDIPKKYLELLFMILRQNRYIKTKRGTSGGYKLAKPASAINAAEIIRLMDGALAATDSVSRYFFSDTPLSKEKKIIKVFKEIRDYIAERLENLTLADLI